MVTPESKKTCRQLHQDCLHGDRGDAAGWAVVFIWGALVMLAEATNYSVNFSGWDGWAIFFTGVGLIVLLGATARLAIPEHRKSVAGRLACGLILLSFGLGDRIDWEWVWPTVMIVIGVTILRGVFFGSPDEHASNDQSGQMPSIEPERETCHG